MGSIQILNFLRHHGEPGKDAEIRLGELHGVLCLNNVPSRPAAWLKGAGIAVRNLTQSENFHLRIGAQDRQETVHAAKCFEDSGSRHENGKTR